MTTASTHLIIMACSATKLDHAAKAMDLYRGVLFSSFKANVQDAACPHVMILSAEHGFVSADTVLNPYERFMTPERADTMLADLPRFMGKSWPAGIKHVMLAGGKTYRKVMFAALAQLSASGMIDASATVTETRGGIGSQRSQLGRYLRELAASEDGKIGEDPNGRPLYSRLGTFGVRDRVLVQYRGRPDVPARPARVEALFHRPQGPTASVVMLDVKPGRPASRWVALSDLRPLHA